MDKCFRLLELLAESPDSRGISDLAAVLDLSKSTVSNLCYTLADLDVLAQDEDSRFRFGARLYMLGLAAGRGSELIKAVHPCLAEIAGRTNLSAFFGVRADSHIIVIDKVDSDSNLRIASDVGVRLPLFYGAMGKVLSAQLADAEVDRLISRLGLKRYTAKTVTGRKAFLEDIHRARRDGVVIDDGEYIDGIVALAVPIDLRRPDTEAAIWAVGLKQQAPAEQIPEMAALMRRLAGELDSRFLLVSQTSASSGRPATG